MIKIAVRIFIFYTHNLIFIAAFLFCCFTLTVTPAQCTGKSDRDLQYTVINDNTIVVSYQPQVLTIKADTIQGAEYTRLLVSQCSDLAEKGKPGLVYRTLFLAVPEGAKIFFQIINCEYSDQDDRRIAPAVFSRPDTGQSIPEVPLTVDAAVYGKDAFFPETICQVEDMAWLRRVQVAPIRLFPIQYNPLRKRLRIVKKMTIQFNITPGADRLTKSSQDVIRAEPVFDHILQEKILNYGMASKWSKSSITRDNQLASIPTGSWFRIPIVEDGIFRLDYQHLHNMGYDSLNINPEQMGIYYGGGRELPVDASEPEPEIRQIATDLHDANADGLFGKKDYLLFYGQGTYGWGYERTDRKFSHYINSYTNQNVYWLYIGKQPRKHMPRQAAFLSGKQDPIVTSQAVGRLFAEKEVVNDEKSGYHWWWDRLRGTTVTKYPIQLDGLAKQDSATLNLRVQGASEYHHDISFFMNQQLLGRVDLAYTLAKSYTWPVQNVLREGDNELQISLRSTGANKSEILFDWYELEYRKKLKTINGKLEFWSEVRDHVYQYQVQGIAETSWSAVEVSDPFNVRTIIPAIRDSLAVFQDSSRTDSGGRHYLVLPKDQYIPAPQPIAIDRTFPNLRQPDHAADYVIITPTSLNGTALQRLADHRRDKHFWPHEGQPQVKIVSIEEIYDEFSWGLIDPAAIRNFLKYAYNNWRVAPSYVLLVGDACYDIKNNNAGSPATLVPVYEEELLATDDWFVCMEDDRITDMFIGRLPVRNQEELATVVQKIITYDTALAPGPWKNSLLMVADDQFSPSYSYEDYVFGQDSEIMAEDSVSARYDIQKIYLTQYNRNRFGKMPNVQQDLLDTINKGKLYINFLGHGNHRVLTHEDIFNSPDDIGYLENGTRLPLFFAGTCAVGQFDYDRENSMAEELLLHNNGGCFAVIAATRWNAHFITAAINRDFYQTVFSSAGSTPSIGQALAEAKLNSRYPDHRELLMLFGDPAQRLAVPKLSLQCRALPDSISLSKNVLLKGMVGHENQIATDFSGSLFVKFYENTITRPVEGYNLHESGRTLYSDTLQVSNGIIDSHFFLNSTSTFGGENARIVCYAWEKSGTTSTGFRDGSGFINNLLVVPDTLAENFRKDTAGPEIQMTVNGISATNESEIVVKPSFHLNFIIKDRDSGINKNPKSGFAITLQKDNSPDSLWDVTSGFIADDTFGKNGSVAFTFENMTLGRHHLTLSVWDNALNQSTAQWFIEVEPNEFSLQDPLNYPNPAAGYTSFTFTLTHDARVTIKLYTIAGRLVKVFEEDAARGFNKIPQDGWDCTDEDGDVMANGVYLYKISAKELGSQFAGSGNAGSQAMGRLVIMR